MQQAESSMILMLLLQAARGLFGVSQSSSCVRGEVVIWSNGCWWRRVMRFMGGAPGSSAFSKGRAYLRRFWRLCPAGLPALSLCTVRLVYVHYESPRGYADLKESNRIGRESKDSDRYMTTSIAFCRYTGITQVLYFDFGPLRYGPSRTLWPGDGILCTGPYLPTSKYLGRSVYGFTTCLLRW